MIKRLAGAVVALAIGGLGGFALTGPAIAQDEHFPDAGWQAIDTGAGGVQADSAHTAVVTATVAGVTWVSGEAASALGTSLETADVGLPVETGDEISVDYALIEGADPAAGSVRLFYYTTANADTWSQVPTAFAAAPDDGSTSGTLSLTVAADGVVGTLGLVYDTSNGGVAGTVRFSDLTVAGTTVLFVEPVPPCEWNVDLLADDEKCQPPASPSPSASPDPTTGPAAPGQGGGDDTEKPAGLPVTGVGTGAIAVGALALLATGGGLYLAAHRRRVSFTA